ncbi:hypothetical protein [Methylobacterium nonmethylotrophicum]|uniref:Uncharacterized protein n=1 Tax=Methylobacterium nonmethylotrophicum TaxID=1141884 RepID=A0A4Z0NF43_9HYPH|nr:hypothetical protein [Methylobacterium nonmethylotrophicum]TGD94909.1 hypothetical protein EU555_30520 [Methylobacterium nonmethylotrophicum]
MIAHAADVRRKAEKTRKAIDAAADIVAEAEDALEAAKAEVAEAQTARTAAITKAATAGRRSPEDGRIRQARTKEAEAADELAAAEAALAALRASLPDIEQDEAWARDELVPKAICEVALAELPRVLAAIIPALDHAAALLRLAQVLNDSAVRENRTLFSLLSPAAAAARKQLNDVRGRYIPQAWGVDVHTSGDGPAWKAVLQRLSTDPDAAFPALPSPPSVTAGRQHTG